jgi:L,D-peptidoglycan transpeptidase YkuD (ErfK/YbiS/YcfS/YnhG family)
VKTSDIVVNRWGARFMGRRFACSIGRGGITGAKREGDGATPRGTHKIVGMLYRPDRLSPAELPDWALPFGRATCGRTMAKTLITNHMTRVPHRFGHERLTRPDPLYDLILITDWNWPHAVPGKGSAIFVHTWRRPRYPTAGCVAFAQPDLIWIANRIRHQTRIIIR